MAWKFPFMGGSYISARRSGFVVQTRYLVIQNHPEIKDHDFTQVEELWERQTSKLQCLFFCWGMQSRGNSKIWMTVTTLAVERKNFLTGCHYPLHPKKMWRQVTSKIQKKRQQFNEKTRRRIDLWLSFAFLLKTLCNLMLDRFQDHVNVSCSKPSSPSG